MWPIQLWEEEHGRLPEGCCSRQRERLQDRHILQYLGSKNLVKKHKCLELMLEMDTQFENFMQFCEGYLDDSNKKLLALAKKRYHECEEEYKCSQEFHEYILCTEAKILKEESRFYVHLRDFLSILKENKARDDSIEPNIVDGRSKRIHESSESESDVKFAAKRRKIDKYGKDPKYSKFKESVNESSNQSFGKTGLVKECDIQSKRRGSEKDDTLSQHDDSDQEMERSPDTVDDNEDDEDDDENEIWESEVVIREEISESECSLGNKSEMEESEGEDNEIGLNRNEDIDSNNVSDSDDSNSNSNEVNDRESDFEEKPSDLKVFRESEIKEFSKLSKLGMLETNTIEENVILNKIDICLATESEQTIGKKSYQDLKVEDCIEKEDSDDKGLAEVLNISSETEEKADKDKLKKDLISSENCSEVKICIDQDSKIENLSDDNVCLIESDSKPLCLTIECVKGEKKDDNFAGNTGLNHGSGNTLQKRFEKNNKEYNAGEKITSGYGSIDDLKEDRKATKNKTTDHSSDEMEVESSDIDEDKDDVKVWKDSFKPSQGKEKIWKDSSKPSHGKDSDLSTSDDEDQFDSLKAKKFREKCKKKYVVSVGKKKNKPFTSSSLDNSKSNFEHKHEKERSPRKKHTPNNSPKCKKKFSPNKSPIIIFTDSESDEDVGDIEGFKKRFKEKVKRQIQFDGSSSGKHDKNLVKKKHKIEIDNGTDSDEDICHSGKENKHFTKIADKGNMAATINDKERKEKKRVNLITEEIYASKSDSVSRHQRDDVENDDSKLRISHKSENKSLKEKNKQGDYSKEHEKSNEKSPKQVQNDGDVNPGTSSTSDVDNAQKKGSSRQIRKLEGLLESIRNKIEKVRMRELDLDDLDSEASDYLLEDKLQRKFMKVWDKLCELHKAVKSTGRPTDKYFRYQGTRYPDIDRKLEKFINKKKVFPDYHDVRGIIMKVNREKKLHLKSREIDDLSREAFTDIGNQLQKRRTKDFVSTFLPHGSHSESLSLLDDPALLDVELKKKLEANRKSAKSNMDKVMEKYASLQYQVDDKTEEESEEEDEDEHANIDMDLDQLSGVDNTDSEKDHAENDNDNVDSGDKSGDKSWESGPCLEIENLESGQKSAFSSDNPDDVMKLSPLKSVHKHDVVKKDNKDRHFCEQLGLYRTPEKAGIKDTEHSPTLIEENDCAQSEPTLQSSSPSLPPPRREVHMLPRETHFSPTETLTSPCEPHQLPREPHLPNSEKNNSKRDEIKSLGHFIPFNKEDSIDEDETVMILSDNEDDVLMCCDETEKEKKISTGSNKVNIKAEKNQDISVTDKDLSIKVFETSPKISTCPMVSSSPKISVNVTENCQVSESNVKNCDESAKSEEDVKNISDLSNVTVITDDEDEEENEREDQSLGLKIISAHHVSLDDISKLHGEEEMAVDKGIVSGKESEESPSSPNSSTESGKESVKCSTEFDKAVGKKSSPTLPISKEKLVEIKKPSNNIDNKIAEKINEVLNSEPDVMIIDDVFPSSPVIQKRTMAKTIDNTSGSTQGNLSNLSNVNRVKNSNVQAPVGLHSRPGFQGTSRGRVCQSQPLRTNTIRQKNTPAFAQHQSPNLSNVNMASFKRGTPMRSPVGTNCKIISPASSASMNSQSLKSSANLNKGSKTFQQFPCNSNNTNRMREGNPKLNTSVSSNTVSSTSNISWKVQQIDFGITKKVTTPSNMNSKMKNTSNNSMKVQQQKFGRGVSAAAYSTQYVQSLKQMNKGFRVSPKSSFRTQSNAYQPYPNSSKNFSAGSPRHVNSMQKNYNVPQCSPRFTAVPFKINSSTSSIPAKSNYSQNKQGLNKGFYNQGQNTQRFTQKRSIGPTNSQQRSPYSQNQVRKISDENARVKHASITGPKVGDDIVIIDCDEPDQVPVKKNKPSKHKAKCDLKNDPANEVICLDDPPVPEPVGDNESDTICIVDDSTHTTVKEDKNGNNVTKTDSNCTQNSTVLPQCSKTIKSSKENSLEGSISGDTLTCKSNLNSKDVRSKNKREETSVQNNKECEVESQSDQIENQDKLHKTEKTVELDQENHVKEKSKVVEKTSSNEHEKNTIEDEEIQSISDIFEGSSGTVESNECESIESYHDSEPCENIKKPEKGFDELHKDEGSEIYNEGSDQTEIFTAVKLDSVNFRLESAVTKLVENKPIVHTEGPDVKTGVDNVACQGVEEENSKKSNNNQSHSENIKASIKTESETVLEHADDEQASDDDADEEEEEDEEEDTDEDDDEEDDDDNDDEVSCGMDVEGSITSTSCDVNSNANVKIVPTIRNNLKQLEKAIVQSKPEKETRSQAKPQDIRPRLSRSTGRAQWTEEDENASLIETYQEPDSTPYSLEDNQISSSSNDNIIVLSDSE